MEQNRGNPYAAPGSDVQAGAADEYSSVKAFSIKGRLGRVRYMGYLMVLLLSVWLGGSVLVGLLSALLIPMNKAVGTQVAIIALVIIYGVLAVGSFMLAIQRLHDFNVSGWLSLLLLVPLINAVFGLALWFIPGTDGPNRFGAKTPPNGTGVTILAVLAPILMVGYIGVISAIAVPAYQQYVKRAQEAQMHMQQQR